MINHHLFILHNYQYQLSISSRFVWLHGAIKQNFISSGVIKDNKIDWSWIVVNDDVVEYCNRYVKLLIFK